MMSLLLQMLSSSRGMKISTLLHIGMNVTTHNPDLARMALDILAVPPMSDEIERVFSSAKLLLTDRRSRLKMDIIKANECLQSWYGRPERVLLILQGLRLVVRVRLRLSMP